MTNIRKVKRGQHYVVVCHTKVTANKVGLHSRGTFNPGDIVTPTGRPTQDPNKAAIYTKGNEDFPWEDWCDWGRLDQYFNPVPINIQLVHDD